MPWMYSKTASTNPLCALPFFCCGSRFSSSCFCHQQVADNTNQSDKSKLPIKKKQEQNKNNRIEEASNHID